MFINFSFRLFRTPYFYQVSVHQYQMESLPVPVKIIVEARNTSRVSLGKDAVIVRLPSHISIAEKEKMVKQFLDWAKSTISHNKYYAEHTHKLDYYQNRELRIFGKSFFVRIYISTNTQHKLNYRGDDQLHISLNENIDEQKQVKEIQRFLLRFSERYFLKSMQERVLYWNDVYFKERIEKVVLKHTISSWGSCTAQRKITLSTKLLLMPLQVIDYVIIHELAHLKEMNHSPKFWKHVEAVMPDYKLQRKWLKAYGNSVMF